VKMFDVGRFERGVLLDEVAQGGHGTSLPRRR
jgi:hypothetical protein